jgi:hypothetical protein
MTSFINLLGNLLRPQYPAIYLVESQGMKDARNFSNAIFEAVVGELDEVWDLKMRKYRESLVIMSREYEGKRDWRNLFFKLLGMLSLERLWYRQKKRSWRQILQLFLRWVIFTFIGLIPSITSVSLFIPSRILGRHLAPWLNGCESCAGFPLAVLLGCFTLKTPRVLQHLGEN